MSKLKVLGLSCMLGLAALPGSALAQYMQARNGGSTARAILRRRNPCGGS